MASWFRRLVSQHKKRFEDEEFDLDLSYVTNRIIAMAFPAEGAESLYRNPIGDVARMLEKYHGGHYRVYNLCAERTYDCSRFRTGSVVRYPMDDHQVPALQVLFDFVEDATEFLNSHELNTAVVHCKAGKGRTGICIAALLLALGKSHTWHVALAQFAMARTDNSVGVTIASQRRWVQYYDQLRHRRSPPPPPAIDLVSLCVTNCPAKLTPRLIFEISQREYDKDLGYVTRGVLTASMPKESKQSPSFGNLLCGVPGMWHSGQHALPAPAHLDGQKMHGFSSGALGGTSAFGPARRVHLGRGWRISQFGDGTLSLFFEDDGTEEAAHVCRVQGDFKVSVYVDSVSKSRCLFWAWHNTIFMTGSSSTLTRDHLDKVNHSVPSKLELTLQWHHSHDSSMMMDGMLHAAHFDEEEEVAAAVEGDDGVRRGSRDSWKGARCVMDDPHVFRPADPLGPLRKSADKHSLPAFFDDPLRSPAVPSPLPAGPPAADELERCATDSQAMNLDLLERLESNWSGNPEPRRISLPPVDAVARLSIPSRGLAHSQSMRKSNDNRRGRRRPARAGKCTAEQDIAVSEPLPPIHSGSVLLGTPPSQLGGFSGGQSLLAGAGGSSFNDDAASGTGVRISPLPTQGEGEDPLQPPASPLAPTTSATLGVSAVPGTFSFGRAISQQSINGTGASGSAVAGSAPVAPSQHGGLSGSSFFDHSLPSQSLMSIPDDDELGLCIAGGPPGMVLPGVPDSTVPFRQTQSQPTFSHTGHLLPRRSCRPVPPAAAGTAPYATRGWGAPSHSAQSMSAAHSGQGSQRGVGGAGLQFSQGLPAPLSGRPDALPTPLPHVGVVDELAAEMSDSAFSDGAAGLAGAGVLSVGTQSTSVADVQAPASSQPGISGNSGSRDRNSGHSLGAHSSRSMSRIRQNSHRQRRGPQAADARRRKGTSAPLGSTVPCEDPLAPWGDPAAVATGAFPAELESAFFTSDGTGYSSALGDYSGFSGGFGRV